MVASFEKYRRTIDLNLATKLEHELQAVLVARRDDDEQAMNGEVMKPRNPLSPVNQLQTLEQAIKDASHDIDHMLRSEPKGAKYW